MQHTPQDLKEKLLETLDDDNNVIDMDGVLAVITILETYPITRDVLEQTRIGKYVNELRKKTDNEQLAKRAKKLVRNWQKLINPEVNGDHGGVAPSHPSVAALSGNGSKPCSPALSQKSLSPVVSQNVVRSSLSKQYPGYKPNTPTQNFNQSVKPSTPKLPQPQRSKPNTPNMPQYLKSGLSPSFSTSDLKGYSTPKASKFPKLNSVHSSPDLSSTVISSQTDRLSNNGSPSNDVELKGRLSRNVSHESLSSLSGSVKDIPQHSHSTRENGRSLSSYSGSVHDDQSLNSKTNVANKKRTRNENQNASSKSENMSYKTVANGSAAPSPVMFSDKSMLNSSRISPSSSTSFSGGGKQQTLPSRRNANLAVSTDTQKPLDKAIKTPKVKTTLQIIADLRAKSGQSIGNQVIHQIETNQIQKESDVLPSVLPPGARPKRRRKQEDLQMSSTPLRPPSSLSQTKRELVENYLESSITPSSAVDMSPFKYELSQSESLGKEESSIDITDSSEVDTSFRPSEVQSKEHYDLRDSINTDTVKKEAPQKVLTLEEIYSQLRPIDYSSVDYDSMETEEEECEVPKCEEEVSENVLERLHNSEWSEVNGLYDINGAWKDWTQTVTVASHNDEPLYILPYVLTDD